jgi:hypothetical protein
MCDLTVVFRVIWSLDRMGTDATARTCEKDGLPTWVAVRYAAAAVRALETAEAGDIAYMKLLRQMSFDVAMLQREETSTNRAEQAERLIELATAKFEVLKKSAMRLGLEQLAREFNKFPHRQPGSAETGCEPGRCWRWSAGSRRQSVFREGS